MKKPDRVEAGQWWRLLYSEMKEPVRIESTDIYGTMPVGAFDGGWSSASLIMRDGEYLGSGENPEPSEWMIETLAEHGYEALDRGVAPWADLTPRDHEVTRSIARRVVLGEPCDASKLYRQTLLSLYSILRSLGKW